jgi:hypothetical protein
VIRLILSLLGSLTITYQLEKGFKMAGKPKENTAPEGKLEKEEKRQGEQGEKKRGFLWMVIRENIQDIALAILFFLGLRKPAQATETGTVASAEKQVPNWFLSAFPSLTRDDENEYLLALCSHPDPDARAVAEKFEEELKKDPRYNNVKYIVNIVELRREYMEKLKNPAPKDPSGGRLSFEPITLRDPVNIFFSRLLEEKNRGKSPKKTYENQRQLAINQKLLEKNGYLHWMNNHRPETIVGIFLFPWAIIQFIIWILT